MKRWLLILPIVLAPACSGSTEPSGPYGTYRLESVDGQRLPYVEENMRILSTSALALIDVPNNVWHKAYTITWDTEFFDPRTGALVGQHQFVESGSASMEGSVLHIGGETGTLIAGQITVAGLWPLANAARTRSERQLVFRR